MGCHAHLTGFLTPCLIMLQSKLLRSHIGHVLPGRVLAVWMPKAYVEFALQAEVRVREAAEKALEAARAELAALQGRSQRAQRRRQRVLARMDELTAHTPMISHGEHQAFCGRLFSRSHAVTHCAPQQLSLHAP